MSDNICITVFFNIKKLVQILLLEFQSKSIEIAVRQKEINIFEKKSYKPKRPFALPFYKVLES